MESSKKPVTFEIAFCNVLLLEAQSAIAVAASTINGTTKLSAAPKISCSFMKSLTATAASPTTAVRSQMFILNIPSTVFSTLNAIDNPPPTTILRRSKIANTPLKVLSTFLAVPSVIINF